LNFRKAAIARGRLSSRIHPAYLLLAVAVAAYGLLLGQMGFYWDELPMSWIRYELGPQAMTRYFSTNRPIWGMLYQVTTRMLPQIPIYWQVFCLFWRWLAALIVWAIARNLWPARRQLAVVVALCFLVYPGFNQQWTSYLYSHFFIVLCCLLGSFLCMIWSVRHPRWYWHLSAAGMLLSGLNLWMMEYFYTLELFRPFLALRLVPTEGSRSWRTRARRILVIWAPYLAVLVLNLLWRLFVFNNQIYQPTLIAKLRAAPLSALAELGGSVLSQEYAVTISAWAQVFHLPSLAVDGPRTAAVYAAVVLLVALLVALLIPADRKGVAATRRASWWPIGLGFVATITAGGPFWLTGLEATTAYPANRFTLPFMLGVSLVLAGLLELISPRVRVGLVVALISLAAGRQMLWAESYAHDWAQQKSMFWQMLWRAPGIAPHTIVLMNEGALPLYADNSLTGALNWIYDPSNRSGGLDYVLFYPTSRLDGTLHGLGPDQPITYDFISEVFSGNTNQAASFYYQPPGCLRLLDPIIDAENHLIPEVSLMRDAARLSSSAWILADESARMPRIYGPEPAHGWCYYFERAQLAAQFRDWDQVVSLGDRAFGLQDYPNDPVERFVFIEGYANTGNWDRALELSTASFKVSKAYVAPLLCRLWNRIERSTAGTPEGTAALAEVKSMFACGSE
jgi:hypothetical protein